MGPRKGPLLYSASLGHTQSPGNNRRCKGVFAYSLSEELWPIGSNISDPSEGQAWAGHCCLNLSAAISWGVATESVSQSNRCQPKHHAKLILLAGPGAQAKSRSEDRTGEHPQSSAPPPAGRTAALKPVVGWHHGESGAVLGAIPQHADTGTARHTSQGRKIEEELRLDWRLSSAGYKEKSSR